MNWEIATNVVFSIVGFIALILQHLEIKKLKRDLKQSQHDAAHAHNSLAFWQDMADAWRGKFEIANALLFEKDPLKILDGDLGAAVKAARKAATGQEEPPTPKKGFA